LTAYKRPQIDLLDLADSDEGNSASERPQTTVLGKRPRPDDGLYSQVEPVKKKTRLTRMCDREETA